MNIRLATAGMTSVAGAAAVVASATGATAGTTPGHAPQPGPGPATLDTAVAPAPHPLALQISHHRAHRTYTVRSGDTLSGIAKGHCGNARDWTGIAAASHVKDPNEIYPGDVVKLACRLVASELAALAPAPAPSTPAATPQPPASSAAQSQAPAAPPTATVTSLSGTLSFSGLEQLWVAAGGPAWAEASAATVAECESGGNQYAHNPSGADGYWQILGQVVGGDIFDPMTNARNAVSKFEASGDTFAQWVCQP